MSDFKFWSWDKKPRTMLRFVKPGDLFCFKLDDGNYCFGRVMSKIMSGHVVEIFNFISKKPEITESDIAQSERAIPPVIIDTYSLFDRKTEGEWRITGHQNNYKPTNIDDVFFIYGIPVPGIGLLKKADINGNKVGEISEEEAKKYQWLSPNGDYDIKSLLGNS